MIGADVPYAASLLKAGKLVAIPTETVYGLAANALDEKAVQAIYLAKGRPQFNPLIIHTNSIERLQEWGLKAPEQVIKLANAFSPGPISFVIPSSNAIPEIVTAGHAFVAVRIPNHPVCLELLSILPFPLAAPSANKSGCISPTTAQHVADQFGTQIPYILDGGACHIGLESSIVSFANTKPQLLRLGGLAKESIEKVLDCELSISHIQNNENPLSPGLMSRHYAPQTPLLIDFDLELNQLGNKHQLGCIRFQHLHPDIPLENQYILSEMGSLDEAAQHLFMAMRLADSRNFKYLLAEIFPAHGLGLAINDRLKRASIQL